MKQTYKVVFTDGNSINVSIDRCKGEPGVIDFIKRIQTGKAGAISGALHWIKNLKINTINKGVVK